LTPEGHVISPAGVRFIGRWEGFRGRLYNDPLGHCTIGFGHLVHRGNCDGSEPDRFKRGITRGRGLKLLRNDIAGYQSAINDLVQVALNQQQFDALVSFAYNIGTSAFATSTLLRKLNRSDYQSVLSELMRWTNGGLPGLVNRRRAEGELFEHGRYVEMDHEDDRQIENEIGGPGSSRDAEIAEGPSEPDEALSTREEGPADGGRHGEAGDNPVDVGKPIDEAETPESLQATALPPATAQLKHSMSVAIDMGLLITSTTGPGHGPRSYHYRRPYRHIVVRGRRYEVARAQDAARAGDGNPDRLYRRYFLRLEQMKPTELFYDPMGYSWLNGQKVDWTPGDHRDHVHVAF
jgi:lysozyme